MDCIIPRLQTKPMSKHSAPDLLWIRGGARHGQRIIIMNDMKGTLTDEGIKFDRGLAMPRLDTQELNGKLLGFASAWHFLLKLLKPRV